MEQSFGSAVNVFKVSALECVRFSLTREEVPKFSDELCFKPDYAHQVFGEDETIFGYKNLTIQLHYLAGSLKCWVNIRHDGLLPPTEEAKADEDPFVTLEPHLAPGFVRVESDFLKELDKEDKFFPHGCHLKSYTVSDVEGNDRHFSVYKCDAQVPGFSKYHARMHSFLTWFIDGASDIDIDDPNWVFYVLFEKYDLNGGARYAFAGYTSVYMFFAYPDLQRARISQFIILPPFGRQGHGSELLRSVYEDLATIKSIKDITVEDPSEEFVSLRDIVDCRYIIEKFEALFSQPGVLKPYSKRLADSCQATLKINQKQFKRLYEILTYFYLDTKNKSALNAYNNKVKHRIKKSLEKPKTKLSKFAAAPSNNEGLDDAATSAKIVDEELQSMQTAEIFKSTLGHYMMVVNKLHSVL